LNRPIRSYVLRQGRTSPAQQRALEVLYPKYGLSFKQERISPTQLFGREAPLVLEVGSGMGETTAEIAAAHPEADFVAIEVHGPGVAACSIASSSTRSRTCASSATMPSRCSSA
jgi:tRNA (guanine-N7-)-methyltransferase